jgi:DNA-binding CsgD family transcriptional regulator/tetratricopeptide (TPR) repeat protein
MLAQQRGLVDVEQEVAYDLAGLHSSRDYAVARHWAQRAVDLAQHSGDRRQLALSLNRLGNVLTNLLQFEEGRKLLEDALAIFEATGDHWGSADSLDLIGMARYLSGEVPEAREAFGRAAAIFSGLGDRERLASALTSRGLYLAVLDGPCATDASPSAFAADAEQGLLLCQELGWRSGEAYAQVAQACAALGAGRYGDARRHALRALAISNEIEHAQWAAIALLTLGILDASLCNWHGATEQFGDALTIANAAGAAQWVERLEAWSVYCDVRKWGAESSLPSSLRQDPMPSRPASIGQRRMLLAFAEHNFARGRADVALDTVERLLAGAAGARPAEVVLLRADILATVGRLDEADAGYLDARRIAAEVGPRAVLWRVAGSRSDLWHNQNPALANAEANLARAEISALATMLDDDAGRASFLEAREVQRWVRPAGRRRTAGTVEAGGLTVRERGVAIEVARGLSNKEIAHSLGISEKTVEMHVGSCLGKLDYVSRTQLATWVVSQGLLATP